MSRLETGGTWIDRSKPLRFRLDGVEYEGFEGDTLASALLANGVVGGFRSPILGRPRGIFSAGVEEPNAFVEISEPRFDPIVAATTVELVDGLVAESRIGVGRLSEDFTAAPRPRVEHRHIHVETMVIGGGLSGLKAAEMASIRGERVMLVEAHHGFGGWYRPDWEVGMGGPPFLEYLGSALERLLGADAVVLLRTTALGIYDDGYVVAHERSHPFERLWHVRARRVVLATGAHERVIAFANNDRPGVMLADAAHLFADRFGVKLGARAVIFTTSNSGYFAAHTMADLGASVVVVDPLDHREDVQRPFEVLAGWTVVETSGSPTLSDVTVSDGSERRTIEADLLLVSGGWTPNLHLYRSIGRQVDYDRKRDLFVPAGAPSWLEVVGRAAGTKRIPMTRPGTAYVFVPSDDLSTHFVDLQRDQTVADIAHALGAGLRSVEHVKRATYIGTAIDQGRTSGALTAEIVNALLDSDPGAQGPSSARPPYVPVSFAAIAGPYRGDLLDPSRTTPIHDRHVERGAVFEDVGQWKRPWYFPRDGEDMDAAVERECLAVRNTVGAMDASTLGKIEVVGPDAPAFLDRMYTNRISNLAVGSIRYGLMCGLDGMVFDDGVAMRLADERYLVTTTTGGAARVLDHFEEWLQTEWPSLSVYCTSVTEQWAVVALNGPRAREVLAAVGTDVDLSKDAFPHMTFREGIVAGVPARVARVSFTGELSFEVHVDGRYGLHVWQALMTGGEPFGIVPYGTETMHVLRAEKGYVIVGQDTDGTVTPYDLGMDWIVNPSKGDFVGRRSLRRADLVRPGRNQLVGLLSGDPDELLPEGAQLVEEDTGRIPMPMVGHVTSSYRSAALGRTFALALVAGGHERHGDTVFAPLVDRTIAATITAPVFYDPEGARRDG